MKELTNKIYQAFQKYFGSNPVLVWSPGRVNLIGEHTDYNDGFVLPAATDRVIVLAIAPNDKGIIRLHSVDMEHDYFEVPITGRYEKAEIGWVNYILGVVDELQKAGYVPEGFDCAFGGNIPIGSGLSSSAALECGVIYGLSELFDFELSRQEMARLAQKAENDFVGVQCGIMDQFASLHGKAHNVIKLDCRSLEYQLYPFEWEDTSLLLCDTKVRRELADSEYNVRRQQCEKGAEIIRNTDSSIRNLRDVSFKQLEAHKHQMEEVVYRRCRYVLEENQRLHQACEDLIHGDLKSFGKRIYQSHCGLRDDYEVSCRELDVLVEATEELDSVLGARMMGGGFGGCTINVVKTAELDAVIEQIGSYYEKRAGWRPDCHVAEIGDGTHGITSESEVYYGK